MPTHSRRSASTVGTTSSRPPCRSPLAALTLEGDRIKEVTAFIVRTTEPPEEDFRRWPDQEAEPERVRSVFERFGLPARVD